MSGAEGRRGALIATLSTVVFFTLLAVLITHAPGWPEVAAWWQYATRCGGQSEDVMRRYAFLSDLLPGANRGSALRRATPTIGFRAT